MRSRLLKLHSIQFIIVTCLLVLPLSLSFPVQPGSEIGEFQIRTLASAFGIHPPTCWMRILPLACLRLHPPFPHRCALAAPDHCWFALPTVHHSPGLTTLRSLVANLAASLAGGWPGIPHPVMKSVGIVMMLRIGCLELEVDDDPQLLFVS
jgi:hypothetical protein